MTSTTSSPSTKALPDISLHLLDIAMNALASGAERLCITLAPHAFTVADNGCGMDEPTLARALTPGWSSSGLPGRGYGLPTLQSATERLHIESAPGRGTTVRAAFPPGTPIGDLRETLQVLVVTNPGTDFRICVKDTVFDTADLRAELGQWYRPQEPELQRYIGECLRSLPLY